jgi:hypothetical protein
MTWPQRTRFGRIQLVGVFLIRSVPASFVRRWHRARRDELSHDSLRRPELFRPDSNSRDALALERQRRRRSGIVTSNGPEDIDDAVGAIDSGVDR